MVASRTVVDVVMSLLMTTREILTTRAGARNTEGTDVVNRKLSRAIIAKAINHLTIDQDMEAMKGISHLTIALDTESTVKAMKALMEDVMSTTHHHQEEMADSADHPVEDLGARDMADTVMRRHSVRNA